MTVCSGRLFFFFSLSPKHPANIAVAQLGSLRRTWKLQYLLAQKNLRPETLAASSALSPLQSTSLRSDSRTNTGNTSYCSDSRPALRDELASSVSAPPFTVPRGAGRPCPRWAISGSHLDQAFCYLPPLPIQKRSLLTQVRNYGCLRRFQLVSEREHFRPPSAMPERPCDKVCAAGLRDLGISTPNLEFRQQI